MHQAARDPRALPIELPAQAPGRLALLVCFHRALAVCDTDVDTSWLLAEWHEVKLQYGVVKLTFSLAQLPSRVPYSPHEQTTRPQPV
jgi:hypothetical protein